MDALYKDCLIEASGKVLTKRFPEAILGHKEQQVQFIKRHKKSSLEAQSSCEILGSIILLADSFELFFKNNMAKVLRKRFSKEQLDILSAGADKDIWYDAHDHEDLKNARIISDTQYIMKSISASLRELTSFDSEVSQ